MILGDINKNINYETIEIDLQGIDNKKDMLFKISKELNFPLWDENNWDAFRDWLSALYEPFDNYNAVKIILKNTSNLNKDDKKILYEILNESAEIGFDSDDGSKRIPCYYEIWD